MPKDLPYNHYHTLFEVWVSSVLQIQIWVAFQKSLGTAELYPSQGVGN